VFIAELYYRTLFIVVSQGKENVHVYMTNIAVLSQKTMSFLIIQDAVIKLRHRLL